MDFWMVYGQSGTHNDKATIPKNPKVIWPLDGRSGAAVPGSISDMAKLGGRRGSGSDVLANVVGVFVVSQAFRGAIPDCLARRDRGYTKSPNGD